MECFDYSDPTMAESVLEYLKGKDVVGAYDAISTDKSLPHLCEILDRCGGRKLIAAVFPGAEPQATRGVQIIENFGQTIHETDVGRGIWKFVEAAVADGRMKMMPPADVVGSGLEDVQKACDILSKGVSAKKLVVAL